MARKGLPKKYAKMGFKKGWAAYKRSKKKGTRKRRASTPKRKTTRRRRASKPQGRKRMGRKGLGIGNKKSALLFAIGAYNAKVHINARMVLKGEKKILDAVADTIDIVEANPTGCLGPPAVGYWFWGKPWRGKL